MIDLIPSQYQSTHGFASVCAQAIVLHFLQVFVLYVFPLSNLHAMPHSMPILTTLCPRFSFSSLFPNMCAASNTIFFILWYRQLLLLFKHHQQINQLFFFFCISNQFISYSGATVWWWWCKGKCGMIDAITDVRIGSTCCGMPNK